MWLFDNYNSVWHMYSQTPPVDGDEAWCGHVKTDEDQPTGGANTPDRCPTCVANFTASLNE